MTDDPEAEIPFTPDELEWLNFNRGVTRDHLGRRVFSGLTFEESKEYYFLKRPENIDFRNLEYEEHDRRVERYLELWRKHGQARMVMCAVVDEKETTNPTMN